MNANIPEFLKQRVGVFKEFSDEKLRELVKGSQARSFEANEVIVHQGAEPTHFGVVLNGTVSASVLVSGFVSSALVSATSSNPKTSRHSPPCLNETL